MSSNESPLVVANANSQEMTTCKQQVEDQTYGLLLWWLQMLDRLYCKECEYEDNLTGNRPRSYLGN